VPPTSASIAPVFKAAKAAVGEPPTGTATAASALREIERVDQPFGERAGGGDADLLGLQGLDAVAGKAAADADPHEGRRFADRRHRNLGGALGDELHFGTGAQREIDRTGDHRLRHLGAAGEDDLFDLDAMLGEDAVLHADIERDIAIHLGDRLADAQPVGRPRRVQRGQRQCGAEPHERRAARDFSLHDFLPRYR
jgi:hypothetical protein